jgi:hypothetical protein
MPYAIIKKGSKFAVENIATGKLHGLTTKPKAEAQKRLLEMFMKKKEMKK